MIPSCFECFIGVKGACEECTPSSGLYVNDLPGISLKVASHAANEEYLQGHQLLRAKADEAVVQVINDLALRINGYKYNSILEVGQTGQYLFSDDGYTYDSSSNSAEVYVMSVSEECPFTSASLDRIEVLVDSNEVNQTLTINNVDYTFDTTANEVVSIDVNQTARSFTIELDSTALQFATSVSSSGEYINFGKMPFVAYYTVCCSDEFFCFFKKMMARAVQLKTGINLFYEILGSDRLNQVVECSRDIAPQFLEEFKGLYEKELMIVSERISSEVLSHTKSCCIECDQFAVQYKLP